LNADVKCAKCTTNSCSKRKYEIGRQDFEANRISYGIIEKGY
jgi:hypothetical protein